MKIIWPVEKLVERRSNGDGHHGEMCFNKTTQNPEKDDYTAPLRLPSHTGSGMLTAKLVAAGSNQP